MKRQIAALTLTALMLSGCGRTSSANDPTEKTVAPTEIPTTAAAETLTTPTAAATTEAPEETAAQDPRTLWRVDEMDDAFAYHVVTEYWRDDSLSTAPEGKGANCVFICRDRKGDVLWTHESPQGSSGAQVNPVWPLGFMDDMFLYYVLGQVIALDLETGEMRWESSNTGICLSGPEAAWTDDDFVCLGEFFGSNLAVLNAEGQLIREVPTLDPNLNYITRITRNGNSLTVHLDDFDITKVPAGGPFPDGTDLTVPIDWIS